MAEITPANSSLDQVDADEKQVAHAHNGVVDVRDEKDVSEVGPVAAPVTEKKQSISDLFTIVSLTPNFLVWSRL